MLLACIPFIINYIDVNECDDEPCDQKCTNTRGSFTCGCGAGYRLNDDGRTCSGESAMMTIIQ